MSSATIGQPSGQKPAFLQDLPPFPQVALRAIQVLSEESSETKAIVQVIGADTGFTAELLRVANSPLYGMSQQIKTLRHAVVVMGRERLRSITMTVAMQSYLKAPFRSPLFQRCWRHSLATALLSSGLAAVCDCNQEEAYTAGLLHDVGKFALLIAHQREYAAMLRSESPSAVHLMRREDKQFGIDHCQVGWWLQQDWGLPKELGLAAACHHDEPPPEICDSGDVVMLGCRLATALGFDSHKISETWTVEDVAGRLPADVESPLLHPERLAEAVERQIGAVC